MPGQLDRLTRARCPACGGWDMGAVGLIHHKRDCARQPCVFCGLEVFAAEKRSLYNGATCHLDCAVDFEHDRDKETW